MDESAQGGGGKTWKLMSLDCSGVHFRDDSPTSIVARALRCPRPRGEGAFEAFRGPLRAERRRSVGEIADHLSPGRPVRLAVGAGCRLPAGIQARRFFGFSPREPPGGRFR